MKSVALLTILALQGTWLQQNLVAQQITPQQVRRLLEQTLPRGPMFVPGQVIVKMKTGAPLPAARLAAFGVEVVDRRLSGGEYIYRIPPQALANLAPTQAQARLLTLLESMRASPEVEYVQPNYRLYIVGGDALPRFAARDPGDPRYADQWHYRNNGTGSGESRGGINLPKVWETSTGSSNVVVSIIDTGILPGHADITGSPNLIAGYDMISDPAIANDGSGRDADATDPGDAVAPGECGPGQPPQPLPNSWHGTHVAGTVGVGNTNNAVGVAGINWNVSVQPVRVLGKCGATTADINDAIRWAAGLTIPGVPANPRPAKVINMSLGTPPGVPCALSPSTQAAINDAVARGAAVVVAAGNDAADASQVMPASCNGVITVAASDARGHLVTRYSNFGSTVEIMAPGGDVNRDDDGNGQGDGVLSIVQGGYAFYNGTSMAAPHVAGVVALWMASDPALTPAQALQQLQANALPRTSTECPKPCGAGLLNAHRGTGLAVTVRLDPDKRLRNGETTTVLAAVTLAGAPQAGKTVTFATDNPSVATVSPTSAVTGTSGEATTTLTGRARGDATVTVTVDGATASTPVKVPDLSTVGLLLLALLLIMAQLWRTGRRAARA
jgi:serine protease